MVRRASLLGAAVIAAFVLSPPFDARADRNLVWHMSQHLLLLTLTGPLLVAAVAPRRCAGGATTIAIAVVGAVATVTAWHAPVLFDAATQHVAVHVAEHASFIVGSAALWWLAGSARQGPAPVAVLAVFVVSLAGTSLGAAMTLSTTPWYAAYPNLVDQQVAGALMWAVGGGATTICGLVALVRSLELAPAAM